MTHFGRPVIVESGDKLNTNILNDLINYANAVIISKNNMDLGVNRNVINFKGKIQSYSGNMSIHGTEWWLDSYSGNKDINRDYSIYGENICVLGQCVQDYNFGGSGGQADLNQLVGYVQPKPNDTVSNTVYEYIAVPNRNNSVQNIGGIIYSAGKMDIKTANLENIAIEKYSGSNPYNTHYEDRNFGMGNNRDKWTPEKINYLSSALTIDENYRGTIRSGGDLIILAQNILNHSAIISSGGNMHLYSQNLNNTRTSFRVNNITVGYHKSTKNKITNARKNHRENRIYSTVLYSDTGGLITANGDLNISAETINIDNTLDNNLTTFAPREVTGANAGTVNTSANAGSTTVLGTVINGEVLNSEIGDNSNISINSDVTIRPEIIINPETVSKDYSFNKPNSDYLFETNLRFYDRNAFFGSEYFLGSVGISTNDKFLGDAYFETEYIMNEIVRMSNRPYISGASNSADQMKVLYANSADIYYGSGLIFGVAPTSEQLASIDNDFIWYVKQIINGQEVLVPTLYLSEASKKGDTDGSVLLAGGSMNIKANNLNSRGTISSDGDMTITAGNVNIYSNVSTGTTAGLSSGGDMNLTVFDDFLLAGGTVSSVGDLTLDAGNINITGINNTTYDVQKEGKYVVETTTVYHTGSEISSGGNLKLSSDKDITISGSKINADGDGKIDAKGNILVTTGIEGEQVSRSKTSDGNLSTKTTLDKTTDINSVGSQINIGGTLNLASEGNTTFIGSNVNAEDALLIVGGDLVVQNSYDKHSTSHSETSSNYGGIESELYIKETEHNKVKGSEFNINGDLTVVTGGNAIIQGSNLNAKNDLDVYTGYVVNEEGYLDKSGTGGSFYEIEARDQYSEYEKHEKTSFVDGITNLGISLAGMIATAGNPAMLLLNDSNDVGFKDGKLTAEIKIGEKSADITKTVTDTAVSAEITAGNNITIVSDGDVNIQGSNISAQNDINITATNDINITTAKNTATTEESHEKTEIYATASAGNSYVDAGYAAYGLYEAGDAVVKATEELNRMQKLYDDGKATNDALNDARINLAMANANLANATIAAATAVAGAATSAPTSLGTGIYGNVGLSMNTSTDTLTTENTYSTGSDISAGGNIAFNAGGNMLQSGSNVSSTDGNIEYNIKNNLFLEASKNKQTTDQSSKNTSASVTVGTNSVSGSVNSSTSSSKSSDTSYANSGTFAENGDIAYNVGGDMTGIGYNATGKNIIANVDGNLTLTSVQNTGTSSNKSTNVGVSAGSGSVGGSFGQSRGSGEYAETVISSLVGTESVDLNIGGKLSMTGSVIANIDENNKDGGNLDITAGSLEWNDLDDYNRNKQTGFNVGTNIGVGETTESKINRAKGISDTAETFASGSTNIGFNRSGHETEGVTYATIGNGSIVIKDGTDTTGLNRDINNTQETTKDVITGALDVQASIDNRLLSGNGLKEIAHELNTIEQNLEIMTDQMLIAVSDILPTSDASDTSLRSNENTVNKKTEESKEIVSKEKMSKLMELEQNKDYEKDGLKVLDMAKESIDKANKGEPLTDYDKRVLALYNDFNKGMDKQLQPGYDSYRADAAKLAIAVFTDKDVQKIEDACLVNPAACPTLFKTIVNKIDSKLINVNLNRVDVTELKNGDAQFSIKNLEILGNAKTLISYDKAMSAAAHEAAGHYYHYLTTDQNKFGREYLTSYANGTLYYPLQDNYKKEFYVNQPSEKIGFNAEDSFYKIKARITTNGTGK